MRQVHEINKNVNLYGFSSHWIGPAVILQSKNLLVQSKRFRGKINIQRPKPPHYERALFNAVTKPIYEKIPIIVTCREKQLEILQQQKEKPEPHQYEKICGRELRELFESNEMAIICHRNSIRTNDFFDFKVLLHKKNVKVKLSGKRVQAIALNGTKFENLQTLFEVSNCMLFGSASALPDVLKILRKSPKVVLLAGTIHDRILSKNELVELSNMPDLQILRAQFTATLNIAGGQILNNLQAHQSNLCYLLDAHAKQLSETTSDETTSTKPTDVSSTATETKTE